MNRNMIEANKMLFDRLWTLVPERLTHFAKPATKRYVATTGEQQDFIRRATVHCNMELAPGFSGSIVQHPQRGRFAVLPGAGPVSFEATLPDLRVQACDAGWLTVLGSECDLRLSDEAGIGEQVLDHLFGRGGDYNAEELFEYFAAFHIVDISAWSPTPTHQADLTRAAVASLLTSKDFAAQLEPEAVADLLQVTANDSDCVLAAALYRALTATHWVHCYLELYRCVEFFYPSTYVKNVADKLRLATHAGIYETLTECLEWRPREEHALKKLLDIVGPDMLVLLRDALNLAIPGEASTQCESSAIASGVYKVRNRIAHHRNQSTDLHETPLAKLVAALCKFLHELQTRYMASL